MQKYDLAKWLSGEMSAEEFRSFKESPEYAAYTKIAESSKHLETPPFDAVAQLEHFKATQFKKQPKVIALRPLKLVIQVAAVLALLFATYWIYSSRETVISSNMAQSYEVLLPDTSMVRLNADSELSFNDSKWEDNRRVSLRGEAYFVVAKGKKFDVKTSNGIISVLGTQFNVKSRSDYFEVTCYEGLVQVVSGSHNVKLRAGATFRQLNQEIIPLENTVQTSPSWLDNESSFKAVPLTYVLEELERQYAIEVIPSDIDLQQLYSGSFVNNDLTLALQSISIPLHLEFKIEGSKVLIYETP